MTPSLRQREENVDSDVEASDEEAPDVDALMDSSGDGKGAKSDDEAESIHAGQSGGVG
jgi:hypothetical protein